MKKADEKVFNVHVCSNEGTTLGGKCSYDKQRGKFTLATDISPINRFHTIRSPMVKLRKTYLAKIFFKNAGLIVFLFSNTLEWMFKLGIVCPVTETQHAVAWA